MRKGLALTLKGDKPGTGIGQVTVATGLPNPAEVSPNGRGGRAQSVTDIQFANGRLFVAGLSGRVWKNRHDRTQRNATDIRQRPDFAPEF